MTIIIIVEVKLTFKVFVSSDNIVAHDLGHSINLRFNELVYTLTTIVVVANLSMRNAQNTMGTRGHQSDHWEMWLYW